MKNVTAGPLANYPELVRRSRISKAMEIFRQLVDGELTEAQMQAVIDHENPFVPHLLCPFSFEQARAILGKDNVYSARDVHNCFHLKIDKAYPVLYCQETLEACAADNANGHADWRLVFMFPWNFMTISDRLRKFLFTGPWGRCRVHARLKWGQRRPQPGYVLCNFRPTCSNLSYQYLRNYTKKIQPQENLARVVELLQILSIFSLSGSKVDGAFAYHCEQCENKDSSYLVRLKGNVFDLELFPTQGFVRTDGIMVIKRQELTEANLAHQTLLL